MELSGIFLFTKEPAPIKQFFPIFISGKIVELAPIDDPSPTDHLVFDKSLFIPLLGYLSLVKQTAGPIKQLFSIRKRSLQWLT